MSSPPARKLTTSAMIASFADPGQRTTSAPFGHALARLADERAEIVGLSADLAKYTDMHVFREAHPLRALSAAVRLEQDRIDVAVLHVPTIKPLDREAIRSAADPDRLMITLENHTMVGGLGEAVAATVAYAGLSRRIVPIGVPDEFLAAGALPTLHDRYGLYTEAVIARVGAELGAARGGPQTHGPPSRTAGN